MANFQPRIAFASRRHPLLGVERQCDSINHSALAVSDVGRVKGIPPVGAVTRILKVEWEQVREQPARKSVAENRKV
jgi:hypothetical protein